MNDNNFGFGDENFGEKSEMTSQTVDWGMPGDFITGTFVKARHGVETQFGPNSIYEIYAEKGEFHKMIKKVAVTEPTKINKGETWSVWGRGDIFCGQMNGLHPGQIVKIMYAEEKEGKNGTWKLVKIYAPKTNEGKPMMNDSWLENQGVVGGDM